MCKKLIYKTLIAPLCYLVHIMLFVQPNYVVTMINGYDVLQIQIVKTITINPFLSVDDTGFPSKQSLPNQCKSFVRPERKMLDPKTMKDWCQILMMHIESPQTYPMNLQTMSFQNMYDMLQVKVDRLARKIGFAKKKHNYCCVHGSGLHDFGRPWPPNRLHQVNFWGISD